jgi:hypothetical protein
MGLDWQVGGKPKPGCEAEFRALFDDLIRGKPEVDRDEKIRRFQSIMTPAHETLGTPIVGRDPSADDWARRRFLEKSPGGDVDGWLEEIRGTPVVQLLPPCDGVPRYSNGSAGYTGAESFRAEFLKDCVDIIGEPLLEEAFEHKHPADLVDYGKRLGKAGVAFARSRGIAWNDCDSAEPDSPEFKVDIVIAASKWCVFWGSRGHYLEPDF